MTIVDTRHRVKFAGCERYGGIDLAERFELQWLYEQQWKEDVATLRDLRFRQCGCPSKCRFELLLWRSTAKRTSLSIGARIYRSVQTLDESYRAVKAAQVVSSVDANIPGYVFGEEAEGSIE